MWRSKSHIESKYAISNAGVIRYDCWTIHSGHHKSTRKPVSIFKFDKSVVKQSTSNKLIQSQILTNLEKNISSLTKLKHPNILSVIEPLEIYKNLFIFVTEPVSQALDGDYLNNSSLDLMKLKGIYEIIQALKFLLESTGNIHLGICPNSILINEKGDWKLASFVHLLSMNEQPPPIDYFINPVQTDRKFDHLLNLDLNFTAPEIIIDSKIYDNSDFWSLGCLIYYVYSNGKLLLDSNDDIRDYERALNHLNPSSLNFKFNQLENLSKELIPILNSMMNRNPVERLKYLDELINTNEFQNNENLQFLIYLDNMNIANHEDLIKNFTNYQSFLPNFPTDILTQKILPLLLNIIDLSLLDLKLINYKLISLVIGMMLTIGSRLSNLSFNDLVFSKILGNKDVFLKNEEIQLILIKNLSLFKTKLSSGSSSSSNQNFNKFLVKLIELTLVPTAPLQIQFQSLNQIDIFLELLDYTSIKNLLFTKICSIFNKTTSYQIKLTILEVFIKFITSKDKSIDKFIIKDSLFPLLSSIKFKDAKILIKILTIYEISIKLKFNNETDEEFIITDILPNIWKLSIDSSLSLSDYETFVGVINELTEDLQKKRLDKLRLSAPENTGGETPISSSINNNTRSHTQVRSPYIKDKDEEFGSFNNSSTGSTANQATHKPVASFKSLSINDTPRAEAPSNGSSNVLSSVRNTGNLSLKPNKPQSRSTNFNSNSTLQASTIQQQQQNHQNYQQQQQDSFGQITPQAQSHPQLSFGQTTNQPYAQKTNGSPYNKPASQLPLNQVQNLPPGFDSNLVMKKNINKSSFNDNNGFQSWSNDDSLI